MSTASTASTASNRRALIVDDLPMNAKLLSALLVANGFSVQIATSAEAALDLLAVTEYAVMLLDMRLPGMDGLTFARTLRAAPSHRKLVIVAVTANAMKSDEAAALAAGCDAFVSKPINTRTFVPLVTQLLTARGAT